MSKPSFCNGFHQLQMEQQRYQINAKKFDLFGLIQYYMQSIICSMRQLIVEQLHIDPLSFGILIVLMMTFLTLLLIIMIFLCCKHRSDKMQKQQKQTPTLLCTKVKNSDGLIEEQINSKNCTTNNNNNNNNNNRRRFLGLMFASLDEFECLTPLIHTPSTISDAFPLETKKMKQNSKKTAALFVSAFASIGRNNNSNNNSINNSNNSKNNINNNTNKHKTKNIETKSKIKGNPTNILISPTMKYITYSESTPSPPPQRRFASGGKTLIVPLTGSNSSRFARKALFMEASAEQRLRNLIDAENIMNKPLMSASINCNTIMEESSPDETSLGVDRTLSSHLFLSSDNDNEPECGTTISDCEGNGLRFMQSENDASNATCYDTAYMLPDDVLSIDRTICSAINPSEAIQSIPNSGNIFDSTSIPKQCTNDEQQQQQCRNGSSNSSPITNQTLDSSGLLNNSAKFLVPQVPKVSTIAEQIRKVIIDKAESTKYNETTVLTTTRSCLSSPDAMSSDLATNVDSSLATTTGSVSDSFFSEADYVSYPEPSPYEFSLPRGTAIDKNELKFELHRIEEESEINYSSAYSNNNNNSNINSNELSIYSVNNNNTTEKNRQQFIPRSISQQLEFMNAMNAEQ